MYKRLQNLRQGTKSVNDLLEPHFMILIMTTIKSKKIYSITNIVQIIWRQDIRLKIQDIYVLWVCIYVLDYCWNLSILMYSAHMIK